MFEKIKSMFLGGESDIVTWNNVEENSDIDKILEQSYQRPQLIYKHSNRCSVCWFAKSELEGSAEAIKSNAEMYFVDVIRSRELSNYIADKLAIPHESPQAILLNKGKVVWHESHGAIKGEGVLGVL